MVAIADFVAGAVRLFYTKSDERWRNLIKERINYEEKIIWRNLKSKGLKGSS